MFFDYVSDIHLDFWLVSKLNKELKVREEVSEFIKLLLPTKKSDILIVAGDISNSNYISKMFFDYMSKEYKYVLFTYGNHDLYLDSKSQANKYKHNSFNRLNELIEYVNSNFNNIYFLDGSIIEIDGIKFGGCGLWYDLNYNNNLFDNNTSFKSALTYYKNRSNDSQCIYGNHYKNLYDNECEKLKNIINDVDVMISHIVPKGELLKNIPFNSYSYGEFDFDSERDKIMYVFNNINLVNEFKGKVWIYGHSHNVSIDKLNDIDFLRNCVGYPNKSDGYIKPLKILNYKL